MDFIERAGEAYLTRKINGVPDQLEKYTKSQLRDTTRPKPQQAPSSQPQAPATSTAAKDAEIQRLKKQIASAKTQKSPRKPTTSQNLSEDESRAERYDNRSRRVRVVETRPKASTADPTKTRESRSDRKQRSFKEVRRQRNGQLALVTSRSK